MPHRREFSRRVRQTKKDRDSSLIVVATEGVRTEYVYFQGLTTLESYKNSHLHLAVLNRENIGQSSPKAVLTCLDDFRRQYQLHSEWGDQLWLVCDTDKWDEGMLSEVALLCHQKNYRLAVSNPCFELWLLLHYMDLADYPQETLAEFRENRKQGGKTTILERELRKVIGRYDKRDLNLEDFLPRINVAIERAKALDEDSTSRWPQGLGTRVYLLAEKIIHFGSTEV